LASMQGRRCRPCGRDYSILFVRGEGAAVDRPEAEIDDLTCPSCGADDYEVVIGLASGIQLGGDAGVGRNFPYFDHALGVEVRSAQHRRWLMQHNADGTRRAVPLVPTEGGFDPVADFEREQAERDRRYAGYLEMLEQEQADPELREARARWNEAQAGDRARFHRERTANDALHEDSRRRTSY
jgi:hypothetical protein